MRKVVLLVGPPGAGKTTAALASGLPVFDRDDPRWSGEAEFKAALEQLGRRRGARAVVIRSGATAAARAAAARLIGATDVFVVLAPRDELKRRVRARRRDDLMRTVQGVDYWLERFDRDDGVRDFPGWPAVLAPAEPALGLTSQDW